MNKTQVLNYTVIVNEEKYEDNTVVYTTFVPKLGLSDYGLTIEEALKNTEEGIRFHIKCLIDEKEEIPEPDNMSATLVTTASVKFRSLPRFNYAYA